MTPPAVLDVKPFIPARDFQLSRQFYLALGWRENWCSDGLAELEVGNARLLLQDFYDQGWAENCMLYVPVTDAQAWYRHASGIVSSFPGSRVSPPKAEPYGATVTYVWDPAGVLLHFAQQL